MDQERLTRAADSLAASLKTARIGEGFWLGELASSALSTATAVLAFAAFEETRRDGRFLPQLNAGVSWLLAHPAAEGGYGDTPDSPANIATTMVVHSALTLAFKSADRRLDIATTGRIRPALLPLAAWIETHGGLEALHARFGQDRTFAAPIETTRAIAGICPWDQIRPLAFELSSVPRTLYRWLKLEVVSYALPALIAMGVALFRHGVCEGRFKGWLRHWTEKRALRKLEALQPESGGFLEAAPLTSFVAMNLIVSGLDKLPVVERALTFLQKSQRPDGALPVDENLSVWLTSHSLRALETLETHPTQTLQKSYDWLWARQQKTVHPFTGARPGGWPWTHLPGGTPDADDTAGALLALRRGPLDETRRQKAAQGITWLLGLQNQDGGWPTFCRGWGKLEFDRSAPDLTAHAMRALMAWRGKMRGLLPDETLRLALRRGLDYLIETQRYNGSWIPLWFGCQAAPEEQNPVYGTARVLEALADLCDDLASPDQEVGRWDRITTTDAAPLLGGWQERLLQDATTFLLEAQDKSGGWGGAKYVAPSIEETAVVLGALFALCLVEKKRAKVGFTLEEKLAGVLERGLHWLLTRLEEEGDLRPIPMGLYFARLWYAERLYPILFSAQAIGLARRYEACQRTAHE